MRVSVKKAFLNAWFICRNESIGLHIPSTKHTFAADWREGSDVENYYALHLQHRYLKLWSSKCYAFFVFFYISEAVILSNIVFLYYVLANDVEVEAVYAVSRKGEDDRIENTKLGNHKLLWHGSRTSNLISIFHRGLLVAPEEAISHTGSALGKVWLT